MIDSKGEGGVTNWADLEGKPSWIGANKPSYTWAEISGKPSTFAPSSHTHNYASTVKVGSTSYNISGNTISLPAYPTVPSALKNPNALTISLNGTSQGAYDGSAAKSFNITAASVGAATSSHSHTIAQVTNLQSTLDGKANTSHIQAWTADECTTYTSDDNTKGCTPAAIKKAFTMFTATAANKVTNTLTFTGYQSKSFNGSTAVSVAIPNNTNQLTNGAGFITSSASISGNAGSATKLQTARTLWGQSFNGTGNVGGNIIGAYFKINDTQTNPYLQLTQGSTWYVQGYNGYLYLGAGSTNSIKIDSAGNLLSPKEITAYSDIRLKKNIRPLENRGYILPIVYERDGKQSIGFSAQEVRELYPELVIEDNTEDKYLSVNYAQYVAVLQAQIIDLKKEIDELKNIKTK